MNQKESDAEIGTEITAMINPLASNPQIQAEPYSEGTNLSRGEGNETGNESFNMQCHGSKTEHHMTEPQVESELMSAVLDEEFVPLSGKPFFHCIILKSHLKPKYQLMLPTKMHPILPSSLVPVVFTRQNRNWEVKYYGHKGRLRCFDTGWKSFAVDNNLKIGDGCVFELMECKSEIIKFRVQILSSEIPSEFLGGIDGESSKKPILVQ